MAALQGTLEVAGFRLHYRVEGQGRPTIVIGSADYYPRIFSQALREHLRMAFVDHRGFARQPALVDRRSFELETLVDDIESLRQALGFDEVVAVGHSGHAYMALEYAKKYPRRVSHVVMIGIAPDLSEAGAASAERRWEESVNPERKRILEANRRKLSDEKLERLPLSEQFIKRYVRETPKIWFDPRFDAAPLFENVSVNEVLARVWGEVFPKIDITRGLEELQRPVFLALGRYDYLVAPPHSWDRIRPQFRELTIRVFERSGHTPPYEEPDLFDAELLAWLKLH